MGFEELFNEFEKTRNVCGFCEKHQTDNVATRFLLIRSLEKENLKYIVEHYSSEKVCSKDSNKTLMQKAYDSGVTIDELISYIESKRDELIREREAELPGLQDILDNFDPENCGVRNDRIDDIIKAFVRDKSLNTMDKLTEELDENLLPRIRKYIMWSFYNQTSNDIIELFIMKHKRVIPTLRKIHDIDFFLKSDGNYIPFDLKFTHISDSFFNDVSKGFIRNNDPGQHDDFSVDTSRKSEIEEIKEYYKEVKKALKLPAFKYLESDSKNCLCDQLISTGDKNAIGFVKDMKEKHKKYIPCDSDSLHQLEWWNYKEQGERLFCNNNRFYVFLAHATEFVDGKDLKGKTNQIGKKITELLDKITYPDIHTVKYHYEKEKNHEGNYTVRSFSAIYSE